MSIDVGTQLVQAYLQANGYFTVLDYPLVELAGKHPARSVTDVDVLAFRFSRKKEEANKPAGNRVRGPVRLNPDPALGCPEWGTDMIVAEVKQGKARVNPASRNPKVLAAALSRFGCCDAGSSRAVVQELLQNGQASGNHGHVIRMVLFASQGGQAPAGWHFVHLDEVFLFLQEFLQRCDDRWRAADFHDPALAWLSLLQKCRLSLQKDYSA